MNGIKIVEKVSFKVEYFGHNFYLYIIVSIKLAITKGYLLYRGSIEAMSKNSCARENLYKEI